MGHAPLTALALAIAVVSVLSAGPARRMNGTLEHVVVDTERPESPHIKAVGDLNGDGRG